MGQCVLSSLRSKRFREAKSEERGFRRFAREKNGATAKSRKEGVGEGSEGNACGQTVSLSEFSFFKLDKPLDFEKLRSPANGARDWLG